MVTMHIHMLAMCVFTHWSPLPHCTHGDVRWRCLRPAPAPLLSIPHDHARAPPRSKTQVQGNATVSPLQLSPRKHGSKTKSNATVSPRPRSAPNTLAGRPRHVPQGKSEAALPFIRSSIECSASAQDGIKRISSAVVRGNARRALSMHSPL